jgi:hypothetical protein
MKNLLILAILIAGGYYAYTMYLKPNEKGPVASYKQFAEHWIRGETEQALAMTDDERVQMALDNFSAKSLMGTNDMAEIISIDFTVDTSSTVADPDELHINAEVKVGFNPAGAKGLARASFRATFKHTATVKRYGDVYKITGFQPSLVGVTEMRI